MIYEGKEYVEVVDGSAEIGDLLSTTKVSYKDGQFSHFDKLYYFALDNEQYPLTERTKQNGYRIKAYPPNPFKRYRYVKDIEETPAPKEKNIPITDSLRYSACNTPAYKLKRSINKLYEEMSELIADKNENYGDSFSKQYQKYGMVSVEMRLNDKFMRLEQLVKGEKDKVGESVEDTLKDIIGYATLALIELEGEK